MNIEQSKKLSIIDFLDKENVTLKKKKGNAYWYLSPFRDEKTASFKVSKKENLWYDYAIKEGGDLVVQGTVESLVYEEEVREKTGLLGRIFR